MKCETHTSEWSMMLSESENIFATTSRKYRYKFTSERSATYRDRTRKPRRPKNVSGPAALLSNFTNPDGEPDGDDFRKSFLGPHSLLDNARISNCSEQHHDMRTQTAMQTSQLQPMPRRKIWYQPGVIAFVLTQVIKTDRLQIV